MVVNEFDTVRSDASPLINEWVQSQVMGPRKFRLRLVGRTGSWQLFVQPAFYSRSSSSSTPPATAMSVYQEGTTRKEALVDPTPLPADLPRVDELGTTSAPLKSAAFFIGAYCKEYNGLLVLLAPLLRC